MLSFNWDTRMRKAGLPWNGGGRGDRRAVDVDDLDDLDSRDE